MLEQEKFSFKSVIGKKELGLICFLFLIGIFIAACSNASALSINDKLTKEQFAALDLNKENFEVKNTASLDSTALKINYSYYTLGFKKIENNLIQVYSVPQLFSYSIPKDLMDIKTFATAITNFKAKVRTDFNSFKNNQKRLARIFQTKIRTELNKGKKLPFTGKLPFTENDLKIT